MENIILRQLKNARQHLNTLRSASSLQSPERYIIQKRDSLSLIASRLLSVQQRSVSLKRQKFISLTSTLDAISPLKVLVRGYAMVTTQHGEVVKSTTQLQPNDLVSIRLSDGHLQATINKTTEDPQ